MYILNRSYIAVIIIFLCRTLLFSILILTGSTTYAAEKDQIKIEQFSLNRSVAYLGEEIIASVTVSAPPAIQKKVLRLRYYLDSDEIGVQTITSFDPVGNAKTEFNFKDAPEGRFLFRIVLDIEGDSMKSVKVSRQLAILSLPGGMTEPQLPIADDDLASADKVDSGKPDLEPAEISFDIASPRVGEKVRIKSRISNAGEVQADNVKIRIFINGQPHGEDITMNIAAGAQADIETDFLPASEGKKDVLVLINPDGELEEKSNRNNLLSKTLVVRPAEKITKPAKIVASAEDDLNYKSRANLVIYIETISGVHYTTDGEVRFYITNNSQTVKTKPFTMGAQLYQGSAGRLWLLRQPVKALNPSETVTVSLKWPENQFSTSNLYVASVDIEGDNDETDIRDNHTQPFRVVSTAMTKPVTDQPDLVPEIIISRPLQDEQLNENGTLTIDWKSTGNIGERVRISVLDSKTKAMILSSVANNDGEFSIDLSIQDPGQYTLTIKAEDNTDIFAERNFHITARETRVKTSFLSPLSGTSYRGEQEVKVTWPENLKTDGLQFDLVLQENSRKRLVKLNQNPINASSSYFSWQVPDNGSIFGVYSMQARSLDGRVLAITDEIEFLPNFVSFDQPDTNREKEVVETDLEIAKTGFNGKDLEFLVMNNGPADISVSALLGYKFTSYFVRKVPISSDADVVICQSTLLAELPHGEGQIVSLGRNPDCPLGERQPGSKFEYVVNRFTLPKLLDQRLVDPKMLNNTSKYYWPE